MLHPSIALAKPTQKIRFCYAAMFVALPVLAGCHLRPPLKPYEGQWVLNARRTETEGTSPARPLMILKLSQHHRSLTGTLVMPTKFEENADGTFHAVEPPLKTQYITAVRWGRPQFDLVVGSGQNKEFFPVMLAGPDHLVFDFFGGQVPPLLFERKAAVPIIDLATDWPQQKVTTSN